MTEERQPVRHSIEEKDGRIVIEFDKVPDEQEGDHYEITNESVKFVPAEKFCPECGASWSEGYTQKELDG